MALDTSVSGWLDELRHGRAHVDKYMHGYRDDVKNFVGTGYKEGFGRNQPENHTLEWFSLMRAQCLMGNPRFRWSTDIPGEPQARAAAYSWSVTNWSRQTRMRNLNEKLLMDWGFRRAVCLVTSEPKPGYREDEDPPYWPAAFPIGAKFFRSDPAALTPETWAWSAHLNIGSRKELLRLAEIKGSGWDAKALRALETMNVRQFRDEGNQIPERDEVPYWEIWAPGVQSENKDETPDKGYHGTIFTVVDNQPVDVGWVRPPRGYYGPRAGPYVVSGNYVVPGEAMPLSHVVATRSQADHLNRVKRATIRAIEAYKKIILVRNGNNLETKIKDGKDLFVYSYDDADVKSNVVQMEIAGATQQHFAAAEDAHGTLDRVSGMTDEMRGETQSGVKATQSAIAAQAAGQRSSFDAGKFRDFVGEIGRRVGYFFARDKDVEQDLPPEIAAMLPDPQTGEPMQTAQLKGGVSKGESPDEFDNMGFEVDVGSMERDLAADVQMKDAIVTQSIQELATVGPQTARFIDWQKRLDMRADMFGVPELRKICDVKAMQEFGDMMLQAGQGQPSEAPNPVQGSQPRLTVGPTQKPRTGSAINTMAQKASSGPQTAAKAGGIAASKRPAAKVGAA